MSNSMFNALTALIEASEGVEKQKCADLGVIDTCVAELSASDKDIDTHIARIDHELEMSLRHRGVTGAMEKNYLKTKAALKDASVRLRGELMAFKFVRKLAEETLDEDREYVRARYSTGVIVGLHAIFNVFDFGKPIAYIPGHSGKYATTIDFINTVRADALPPDSASSALAEMLPAELLVGIKAMTRSQCKITLKFNSSWRAITTEPQFTLVSTVVSCGGSSHAGPVVGCTEPEQLEKYVGAHGNTAKTTFDGAGKYFKEFQLAYDGFALFGAPRPVQFM